MAKTKIVYTAMGKVYYNSCVAGTKNFFKVPEKLQPEVRDRLESDGYQINDDGTVEKKPENTEVE